MNYKKHVWKLVSVSMAKTQAISFINKYKDKTVVC